MATNTSRAPPEPLDLLGLSTDIVGLVLKHVERAKGFQTMHHLLATSPSVLIHVLCSVATSDLRLTLMGPNGVHEKLMWLQASQPAVLEAGQVATHMMLQLDVRLDSANLERLGGFPPSAVRRLSLSAPSDPDAFAGPTDLPPLLAQFPHLEGLDLTAAHQLEPLPYLSDLCGLLPSLRSLKISGPPKQGPIPSDGQLAPLSSLTRLTNLHILHVNDASDADLSAIASLQRLHTLALRGFSARSGTEALAACLARLRGLKKLMLQELLLPRGLSTLTSLSILRIEGCSDRGPLSRDLLSLTGLVELGLSETYVFGHDPLSDDEDYSEGPVESGAFLTALSSLTSLTLCEADLSDMALVSATGLRRLRLERVMELTAEKLAPLNRFPRLDQLCLTEAEVQAEAAKALVGLQRVFRIEVSRSIFRDGGEKELGRVPRLKSIDLSRSAGGTTGKELGRVPTLVKVAELNLTGCLLSHDLLGKLTGLTCLTSLILAADGASTHAKERMEDSHVEHLTLLARLRRLDLSNNQSLTSEALQGLTKLTRLQFLDISGIPKVDASLALDLLSHLSQLEELALPRTKRLSPDDLEGAWTTRPNLRSLEVLKYFSEFEAGHMARIRLEDDWAFNSY